MTMLMETYIAVDVADESEDTMKRAVVTFHPAEESHQIDCIGINVLESDIPMLLIPASDIAGIFTFMERCVIAAAKGEGQE